MEGNHDGRSQTNFPKRLLVLFRLGGEFGHSGKRYRPPGLKLALYPGKTKHGIRTLVQGHSPRHAGGGIRRPTIKFARVVTGEPLRARVAMRQSHGLALLTEATP